MRAPHNASKYHMNITDVNVGLKGMMGSMAPGGGLVGYTQSEEEQTTKSDD